jgi:hypothetical protein
MNTNNEKEQSMSIIDDIRQAVGNSTKLDAGTKTILTDFLQNAGPALESLAPDVVKEIINNFAAGNGTAAITTVADGMSEEQVAAALEGIDQQMSAAVDARTAQVTAAHTAMTAVANAALSVLARLLISAL